MSQADTIKHSTTELAELFQKQMSEFQKRLDAASPENPTVTSLASDFSAFKEFIMKTMNTLQNQVELLTRQVDHIETRSRRKMLLVHGIAEAETEDTASLVANTLRVVRDDFTAADVGRSHRLGGRSGRSKKPRAILVEFKDIATRDDVWFAKVGLKGTGVTLGEFLTRPRHNAFMEARERFGIRSCWTWNGDVFILSKDGVRRRANSVEEVRALPAATAVPAASSAAVAAASGAKPAPQVVQAPRTRPKRAPAVAKPQ